MEPHNEMMIVTLVLVYYRVNAEEMKIVLNNTFRNVETYLLF